MRLCCSVVMLLCLAGLVVALPQACKKNEEFSRCPSQCRDTCATYKKGCINIMKRSIASDVVKTDSAELVMMKPADKPEKTNENMEMMMQSDPPKGAPAMPIKEAMMDAMLSSAVESEPMECNPSCACKAGYVLDKEDGECIMMDSCVDESSGELPAGQVKRPASQSILIGGQSNNNQNADGMHSIDQAVSGAQTSGSQTGEETEDDSDNGEPEPSDGDTMGGEPILPPPPQEGNNLGDDDDDDDEDDPSEGGSDPESSNAGDQVFVIGGQTNDNVNVLNYQPPKATNNKKTASQRLPQLPSITLQRRTPLTASLLKSGADTVPEAAPTDSKASPSLKRPNTDGEDVYEEDEDEDEDATASSEAGSSGNGDQVFVIGGQTNDNVNVLNYQPPRATNNKRKKPNTRNSQLRSATA